EHRRPGADARRDRRGGRRRTGDAPCACLTRVGGGNVRFRKESRTFPPPSSGGDLQAEQLADDLVHDLVGAAADAEDAGVAEVALDLALAHQADTTGELNRLHNGVVADLD